MAKSTSLIDRIPWEQAHTAFLGLGERKQWLVLAGILFALVVMVIIPVSCASRQLGKLEKEYLNSQKNLTVLAEKVQANLALQAQIQSVQNKMGTSQGAGLTTVLSQLAEEVGVSDKIKSLDSRKISSTEEFEVQGCDVRMTQISLDKLVDYLQKIEGSTKVVVTIRELQIKPRYANRDELDATVKVSTLVPKGKESAQASGQVLQ